MTSVSATGNSLRFSIDVRSLVTVFAFNILSINDFEERVSLKLILKSSSTKLFRNNPIYKDFGFYIDEETQFCVTFNKAFVICLLAAAIFILS